MSASPLRVLFLLEHAGHLRKFEAAVRSLAERGHTICLAVVAAGRTEAVAERLAHEHPTVRVRTDAPRRSIRAPYGPLALMSRQLLSDLRHLSPRYAACAPLRAAIAGRLPPALVRILERASQRAPRAFEMARWSLTQIERITPVSGSVRAFLQRERPDVLLATPLVTGTALVDYVRTAARLGIPSVLPVASWDNLTTKGILHAPPDAMIVWNEAQRLEAVHELAYPPSRVVVTGAHTFDDWFCRTPGARGDLCARAGLDPERRYVLYVCSSKRIAADETGFVREWIGALRASGNPRLRELGVLVRPHPLNASAWTAPSGRMAMDGVAVWPPAGEDPVTSAAKADYFDALSHSAAVVGLNTTALIEAGIVGRPVLTVVRDGFGQETMPHFHHLVDGGLLRVARGLDEHLRQLAEALGAPGAGDDGRDGFVRTFVRPHGVARAAAPLFADTIERVALAGLNPLEGTRPPGIARRVMWGVPALALALAAGTAALARRQGA